jgi:hypothetical protein
MARTPKSTEGANGPAKIRRPAAKKPNGSEAIPDDLVAKRAYEIYQARGGQHGGAFDDWLEAERQLRQGDRVAAGPSERPKRPGAASGS